MTPTTRDLLPFLKAAPLQISVAEQLLALTPEAALLVHRDKQRILAANPAAVTLTAHTRKQLLRLSLPALLAGFSTGNCASSLSPDERQYTLNLGNGTRRLVNVSCRSLGDDVPWAVVVLSKTVLHPYTTPIPPEQWGSNFLQALEGVAAFVNNRQADSSINPFLLHTVQALVQARLLGMYRAEAGAPQARLRAASLPEHFLPEHISAQELASFRAATSWSRGERPKNRLQVLAHAADYRFLVTAPVGHEQHLIGILVVGDQERKPPAHILLTLRTLGKFLYILIREERLRQNLQRQIAEKNGTMQRYQDTIEKIPVGVIYTSADLRTKYLNTAAETLLGYASPEARNWPVQDILIGPDNLHIMLEHASQGETIQRLGNNTRLHHRNGTPFPAQIQVIPLGQGKPPFPLLILIEDLSQRRAIELRNQQLEQRALLGEVTSIFAHEVRNPVNNISMGLQLMAANLPPEDPQQELIGRMQTDAQRLMRLMESILAFSRGNNGKAEPLDLTVLLENLLSRWKPRFIRQHVEARLLRPIEAPLIEGHAAALEQVFNNLFSNALRAMEDGGTLTIKITSRDSRSPKSVLQVDVADTGVGIPPEIQKQIFAPFFTTDQKSGTGLGLAITQRIITSHRGAIQVESYPGSGTVFHITLPILKDSR